LFPEVKFHLVDSIGKKIMVVNEIVSALQLKNVVAEKSRAEDIKMKFDYAVSRAVAPLSEMYHWLKPLISKGRNGTMPDGMFFLKGGDLADEIKASGKQVEIFELTGFYAE